MGGRAKHTARVGSAPEYNGPVLVLLGSQNLMELQREAVEVADVERAKVVVEGIVEERVVDGEVVRLPQSFRGRRGSAGRLLRALAGGAGWFGIGEERVLVGGIEVGSEIETVCNGQQLDGVAKIGQFCGERGRVSSRIVWVVVFHRKE